MEVLTCNEIVFVLKVFLYLTFMGTQNQEGAMICFIISCHNKIKSILYTLKPVRKCVLSIKRKNINYF